ncbi:MAG: alpha/beta hydrolase [Bacteroidetes bacterium]|nr:MAG: alpha/beta hydrolase [Bacteroidota bacterium]
MNKEYKIKTTDNQEIHIYEWIPEDVHNIIAVIQIAHGMAEHAARYEEFASFLTKHGYAVFANDHKGHGKTAGTLENLGYFADENGFQQVVDDMRSLTDKINERFPDKEVFLFGHSMGSFLSRYYAIENSSKIKGLILSGTAGHPGMLGKVGKMLSSIIISFNNRKSQTPLMTKLSFGAFNNAFKPNRTEYDWLSRDNKEVDKYVNDLFCGTIFTAGFYNDLLGGLLFVNDQKEINKTSKDLPVYLIAGDNDPVSENGKGVTEVYEKYKKAGLKDVQIKLYPSARHEILNENNKAEVYYDILNWLEKHL